MDGYAQFCPIAKASEIIGRRWMLLVLRELLCGSYQFNDIHRGVPRMSRSLLAKRLGELEAEGLVDRLVNDDRPEYHLTQAGEALRPIVVELGGWGRRWVGTGVSEGDLDAGLLMWDVQRRVERDQLPEDRTVVCFRFIDAPAKHRAFWLVLEPDEVDLCLNDPGYDEDLYVTSNVETFTRIWLGDADLNRAVREGAVSLSGPSQLRRAFPRWLGLSMFASIPRERAAIEQR